MQDPLAFQNIEKECSPEANCINDFEILLVVERLKSFILPLSTTCF